MRQNAILILIAGALTGLVACGGSPTASSAVSADGSSSGAGATISGSLGSGAGSSAPASVHIAGSAAGMGATVKVAGTPLSTTVDGSGRFTLRNVPGGNVGLQFSGAVSGDVTLQSVSNDDTVTLALSVSGANVTLDADRRHNGQGDQLEGRVESLPPTTAAGTFIVGGQQVLTDANTRFFLGDATAGFAALAIGQRVHVSGQSAGSALRADIVKIQNTNTTIPVQINGIVENFGGTAGAFQFTVSGQLVKGDGTTTFDSSAFTDLRNGVRVEVTGQMRDGYAQATRIHVNVPDDGGGGGQDDSASIEGPLTAKSGGVPNLTLVVAGTTVTTNGSTEVRRKGDVQDLSVLQLNMTLHVVGTRQPNGSIVARMIQIKDDAAGAPFEISGSMGGLKGGCPSVTFGVNGYSIFTDGSTTFTPACSSFKSGDKVKVNGIRQADGSVKATSVARQ